MAQTPCSSLLIRYRVLGGQEAGSTAHQHHRTPDRISSTEPPAQSLVDGPGRWLSEGAQANGLCCLHQTGRYLHGARSFPCSSPSPTPLLLLSLLCYPPVAAVIVVLLFPLLSLVILLSPLLLASSCIFCFLCRQVYMMASLCP